MPARLQKFPPPSVVREKRSARPASKNIFRDIFFDDAAFAVAPPEIAISCAKIIYIFFVSRVCVRADEYECKTSVMISEIRAAKGYVTVKTTGNIIIKG